MFHIKRFLTMKDVMNVLNTLLKDLESTDSLEDLIHTFRNLINLINSHEYLQTSINELSKAKIQDQKHFENIASAVIKDVHQATSELKKKIDCYPRLKKAVNASFFAEIKNKVKLSEYPIEERPLQLIEPFLQLLNAILDCEGTEHLIAPYATIASNNDRKFVREITFSDNIRTFCRDAEHFRGRRDMALWYAWDNITIFHEWTKNGLFQPGPIGSYVYQVTAGSTGDDGLLQRFQMLDRGWTKMNFQNLLLIDK
jgi:hypothetical protein